MLRWSDVAEDVHAGFACTPPLCPPTHLLLAPLLELLGLLLSSLRLVSLLEGAHQEGAARSSGTGPRHNTCRRRAGLASQSARSEHGG